MPSQAAEPAHLPVDVSVPGKAVQDGMALCLSGGGYRAMLFHVGAFVRLNEAALLSSVERISSVSGGSIAAGVLASKWQRLQWTGGIATNLSAEMIAPLQRIASRTIDAGAIITGALLPGTISSRVIDAYRKHLFGVATLQDLPDRPRFVFNATNVQTSSLFRFSKPYAADWRVGRIPNPTFEIAVAVAASSAFPPFLSPLELEIDPDSFVPGSGADLQRPPYTTQAVLTDGGVYDNLGLETAYKRFRTVLVSDGGQKIDPEPDPHRDWARHAYRINELIDNQVRSLRKRQLIDSFRSGTRTGTYWGIRTNIADYGLGQVLDAPFDRTLQLAATPTRLRAIELPLQERLMNWGYAVCDAALRAHVNHALPEGAFPFSTKP